MKSYLKKITKKLKSYQLQAGNGFSLMEVVVGLAVVMIAVTIFGVIVSTVPLTTHARNQNIAYHIAGKKIEQLRNTAFDSLPLSGFFSDPGLSELANSSAYLLIENYDGSEEIKTARVDIKWQEQTATRNVILETLISSSGLNRK